MAILLGLPIFVLRDTYNVVSFVSKEGFTRDDKILVWKVDLGAFYFFYKILYLLIYLFIFFFFVQRVNQQYRTCTFAQFKLVIQCNIVRKVTLGT